MAMAESNCPFDPGVHWIHGGADFSGRGVPGRPNVYRFVERYGRFETPGNKKPSGQRRDPVHGLFHYHQQSFYHREPFHNPVHVRVCAGNNSLSRSLQSSRKTAEDQPATGSHHHDPGHSPDGPVLCSVSQGRGDLFYPAGKLSRSHRIFRVMQPGSISRLVREDRTAFRVQFQGEFPEASSLYWRGLVLWHFDGKSWTRGSVPERYQRRVRGQKVFQYDIILEPHRKKHLFALDLPLSAPPLTRLTEDFTLMARWPMRKAYRYQVRSSPDARIHVMGSQGQIARQLPENGNPEAKLLAAAWLSRLGSPEAVLNQAIQFFKQNGFSYTLKPPLLGEDPVDEFLFGSKSGYCEHFASAFAYLMRAAGIPARVVVGYLGGERNPYGNYLIVKQYHAHAWVEVFLDNQGWIRVDPTAIVAPERVSMGLADSLLSEDLPDFLVQTGMGRIRAYFRKMTYMWDAINLQWNAWFMEYSRTEQMRLLAGVFSHIAWRQVFWMVGLGGLLAGMAVMGWIQFKGAKRAGDKDPVKEAYDLFCAKLEGVGIRREPSQGPVDFARMAGLMRRDLKEPIEAISHQYIALRYMGNQDNVSYQSFLKRIRKFEPNNIAGDVIWRGAAAVKHGYLVSSE